MLLAEGQFWFVCLFVWLRKKCDVLDMHGLYQKIWLDLTISMEIDIEVSDYSASVYHL